MSARNELETMPEACNQDGDGDEYGALRAPLRRVQEGDGGRGQASATTRRSEGSEGRPGRHHHRRIALRPEAVDAIEEGAGLGAVAGLLFGAVLMVIPNGPSFLWWLALIGLGIVFGLLAEVIDLAIEARRRRQHRPVVAEPPISHVRCTDHR